MMDMREPHAPPQVSGPDPLVSANLYASRHLDDVLREIILPCWTRLQREAPGQDLYLWFFRYARRGEHLKVRLHGPPHLRELLRTTLEQAAAHGFAAMGGDPSAEQVSNPHVPPMDEEDTLDGNHPDRSLLWTNYRRSPVIMGSELYAGDEQHTELFTRVLGESSRLVLSELTPELGSPAFAQKRQSLFIKMLISALAETDLELEQWAGYFTYHRDWIIRFLAAKSALPKSQPEAFVEEFEQRVPKSGGTLASLGEIMALQKSAAREGRVEPGPLEAWRQSVARYFRHVSSYRGRPEYDVDPYTTDYAALALFKALQGCANQCGFRLSNEAHIHHLLLRAAQRLVEPDGKRPA